MIEYKEIKLHPTLFTLDVIIAKDGQELFKFAADRYGKSVKHWSKFFTEAQCSTIKSTKKSKLEGSLRIVVNVYNYDLSILAHELIHVLFHLQELTNIDISDTSQEWVAYFYEYIFKESSNILTYTKCDYSNIIEVDLPKD